MNTSTKWTVSAVSILLLTLTVHAGQVERLPEAAALVEVHGTAPNLVGELLREVRLLRAEILELRLEERSGQASRLDGELAGLRDRRGALARHELALGDEMSALLGSLESESVDPEQEQLLLELREGIEAQRTEGLHDEREELDREEAALLDRIHAVEIERRELGDRLRSLRSRIDSDREAEPAR